MTSRTEYRVVAVTTGGREWPMPTVAEPPIDNPGSAEARRDWMLKPTKRPLWLEGAFIERREVVEAAWVRYDGGRDGPERARIERCGDCGGRYVCRGTVPEVDLVTVAPGGAA